MGILIGAELLLRRRKIHYLASSIEAMPFADKFFDTVISTHTLEHVLQFEKTLKELRRLAKKRLIIVVPRQQISKYTPDLHVRFFPNAADTLKALNGKGMSGNCQLIENDWYFVEDFE